MLVYRFCDKNWKRTEKWKQPIIKSIVKNNYFYITYIHMYVCVHVYIKYTYKKYIGNFPTLNTLGYNHCIMALL